MFAGRAVGLTLVLLCCVCAGGLAWIAYSVRGSMQSEQRKIMAELETVVQHIDQELESHIYNVEAMRNLAESYLDDYLMRTANPVRGLVYLPERKSYAPARVAAPEQCGRMVGLGPVPGPNSPIVREMMMAEALTPIMRAIRARSPNTPWVYYSSRRGFMYLFPAAEAEDFFFTPNLLQMEFLAGATPEANPRRKAFWTKPYKDLAGKGLMATVSQPIYRGGEFMGSVSVDVSVRYLQHILDMHQTIGADIALVSEDGQRLAALPLAGINGERGAELRRLPLRLAPWHLAVTISPRALIQEALRKQAYQAVGLVLVLSALAFALQMARTSLRVRELSVRDSLTGLYNRRHFEDSARQHFGAARRGALSFGFILADVDHFKMYNDTYGHQKGDVVLISVARALTDCLQRSSDLVFRVGGEEFAIIVLLKEKEALAMLLDRLNQAVRGLEMEHRGTAAGRVTISLGATLIRSEGWLDLEAAYSLADQALYQAKAKGRDCSVLA